MLSLLIYLLIMLLVFGLIWWILTLIPLPPPFLNIARAVVLVIMVIWLIYLLMPLAGHPLFHP